MRFSNRQAASHVLEECLKELKIEELIDRGYKEFCENERKRFAAGVAGPNPQKLAKDYEAQTQALNPGGEGNSSRRSKATGGKTGQSPGSTRQSTTSSFQRGNPSRPQRSKGSCCRITLQIFGKHRGFPRCERQ